jgi:predicted ABC-type exoprotein transport system permease subunit
MFPASSRPPSGAYQLQQQPLVYRWNVVVAVLLVVVGPDERHISVSSFVVIRNIKILNLFNYLEHIRRKRNSSNNDKLRGLRFLKRRV